MQQVSLYALNDSQLGNYQQARMSRDQRFDGLFFVGVKTTGIFCRPVCKARMPLEKNVQYLRSAAHAIESGFRPCLLCRPDSAPYSCAWQGVNTTVERAITIITEQLDISIESVAQRLGISTRYLAKLFEQHLQISPKRFQLTQRILFAKQLLHETTLSIESVAQSAGFGSSKRLQYHMQQHIALSPSQVRKTKTHYPLKRSQHISLFLRYRPPYDWPAIRDFFALRQLHGNEIIDERSITKCMMINQYKVVFVAKHSANKCGFDVVLDLEDVRAIKPAMSHIRKLLDLDADPIAIASALASTGLPKALIKEGIRLPGIIDKFEGACRAVVGQQVSVKAAIGQLNLLNFMLNKRLDKESVQSKRAHNPALASDSAVEFASLQPFLRPNDVANADVSFLKMPNARKQSLSALATLLGNNPQATEEDWLAVKGIGPWTVNYVKLRHATLPDVFLHTDLIIKQQIKKLANDNIDIHSALAAPYRSYLTLNLWNNS